MPVRMAAKAIVGLVRTEANEAPLMTVSGLLSGTPSIANTVEAGSAASPYVKLLNSLVPEDRLWATSTPERRALLRERL